MGGVHLDLQDLLAIIQQDDLRDKHKRLREEHQRQKQQDRLQIQQSYYQWQMARRAARVALNLRDDEPISHAPAVPYPGFVAYKSFPTRGHYPRPTHGRGRLPQRGELFDDVLYNDPEGYEPPLDLYWSIRGIFQGLSNEEQLKRIRLICEIDEGWFL